MKRSSKLTFLIARHGIKKHELMHLLDSEKVVKIKATFNKNNELVFMHVDQCSEQSKTPWAKKPTFNQAVKELAESGMEYCQTDGQTGRFCQEGSEREKGKGVQRSDQLHFEEAFQSRSMS